MVLKRLFLGAGVVQTQYMLTQLRNSKCEEALHLVHLEIEKTIRKQL